jgi:hypothetical protein
MKKFLKSVGRILITLIGCYLVGVILMGFFPSQIATAGQLLMGCWSRISNWAPFVGTVCGYIASAWNWLLTILPHFGVMMGVLTTALFFRFVFKRK